MLYGSSEWSGIWGPRILRAGTLEALHLWLTRWWFQIFFIFTPLWGRFPFWLIFSRGLKPPTSWGLVDEFWGDSRCNRFGEQQDCDGTSWGKSYYHQDLKKKIDKIRPKGSTSLTVTFWWKISLTVWCSKQRDAPNGTKIFTYIPLPQMWPKCR